MSNIDPIILSALARGKPVSARRVQALADENAQLRAELEAAHKANEMARNVIRDLNGVIDRQRRVVDLARKWDGHDEALAEALKGVYRG